MSGKRIIDCNLLSVSDVIQQKGLDVVNLLKIDVERAELDVLNGIGEKDWPKIRQIAMEVHDRAGCLERIEKLLWARGYQVSSTIGNLEGTGLRNVFAKR
jgi:hypothetical protein